MIKPAKAKVNIAHLLIDRSPATYERMVVLSLIHSHSFYLSVKDTLCPLDAETGLRRQDFSVYRYNVLFDHIASFWGLFRKPNPNPIPEKFLETAVIDSSNLSKMQIEVAQALLEEIKDDFYTHPMTQELIENGVAGEPFRYWMESRISKRAVDEISNKSRQMIMTMDNVTEILARHKAALPEGETCTSMGNEALKAKIRRSAKISTGIDTLDKALGGGFGRWQSTLIAGCQGGGKTVLACQLAVEFGVQRRKVLFVTTEQSPTDLVLRFIANHCRVKYDRLSNREDIQALQDGTDQEFDAIPQWLWTDPSTADRMQALESVLGQYVCFMDWSTGKKSAEKHFGAELERIVQKGFDPEIIIFDWIGGGLDDSRQEDRRLIYEATAKYLIDLGKDTNRAMILLAQLNQTLAMGRAKPGANMMGECKTMGQTAWNFIGISSLLEKGSSAGFAALQNFYLEKARDGIGGAAVPVERNFAFQRFQKARSTIQNKG